MSSSDRVQRDAQVIRFNLEHFGDLIRTCRRNLGMTQEDLARALHIPKSNVSNWERGWSRPDLTLVPELCRMLHLSFERFFSLPEPTPVLSAREARLLDTYRHLNGHDRRCVDALICQLADQEQEELVQSCQRRFIRCVRNQQSAAAGVSVPLDEAHVDQVYVRKTALSQEADEIVPINGDSMEPVYHSGDVVYIQHTASLSHGEIGLFIVNGEGFIKQWLGSCLHSLNPAREDIHLLDSDDVRLVGRVLGKVTAEDWPSDAEHTILASLASDE